MITIIVFFFEFITQSPIKEVVEVDEKPSRKSPPDSDKSRDRDVSLSMAPLPIPMMPLAFGGRLQHCFDMIFV